MFVELRSFGLGTNGDGFEIGLSVVGLLVDGLSILIDFYLIGLHPIL
jgi:hypothetical protein